jgi:hypothetical protein
VRRDGEMQDRADRDEKQAGAERHEWSFDPGRAPRL